MRSDKTELLDSLERLEPEQLQDLLWRCLTPKQLADLRPAASSVSTRAIELLVLAEQDAELLARIKHMLPEVKRRIELMICDDLLTPGTWRLPELPPPSMLLQARYGIVPWHDAGRAELLADLDAWADDLARPVAIRLLYAAGGTGKTRLAIEWIRRRRARRDLAGFLDSPDNHNLRSPDGRWLQRLFAVRSDAELDVWSRVGSGASVVRKGRAVIIVIDYAETRTDLTAILLRVAAHENLLVSGDRIRVLLLARSPGDWWNSLLQHQKGPMIARLLDPVRELVPVAKDATGRKQIFDEAVNAYAKKLQCEPVHESPIPLDDEMFQRVLYLHMAALATVAGIYDRESLRLFPARSTAARSTAKELMACILEHEEHFWVSQASDGATPDVRLARQLVAAATLRGQFASRGEACNGFERLNRGRRVSKEDESVIELLHKIYDCGDPRRYLPGLEPDLLGEGMVLRVATPPLTGDAVDDAWIDKVILPRDSSIRVTTAFTVLARASVADPPAVCPWLERLMQSDLPRRAVLALRAAKAAERLTSSAMLGDLLADVLARDGSVVIARLLADEGIPHPTVSLARVAEWQARIRLAHAPADAGDHACGVRADLLREHGMRLGGLGEWQRAAEATEAALVLYRRLALRYPDRQRDVAGSSVNLAKVLGDLGLREASLPAIREAVAIYRELAVRLPHDFQHHLARASLNLGATLAELGQHEPALAATREAVEAFRALADRRPNDFEAALADGLNNLGLLYRELGDDAAALEAAQDAVARYRRVATHDSDAFAPGLASALLNLGGTLDKLGQREPALVIAREAVDCSRVLAALRPDAFQPKLVKCLINLGLVLIGLEQNESALPIVREGVELCRALAAGQPEAFKGDLATSLKILDRLLLALGQHEATCGVHSMAIAETS